MSPVVYVIYISVIQRKITHPVLEACNIIGVTSLCILYFRFD
jgi:hypothetical protein